LIIVEQSGRQRLDEERVRQLGCDQGGVVATFGVLGPEELADVGSGSLAKSDQGSA